MTKVDCIIVVDVASLSLITELLLMYSRTTTKKTTVQSTPSSGSQLSNKKNTSLNVFQSGTFAICHSVMHPSFHNENTHTVRADQDKCRQISKTSM
jgi:hypothetical protein